MRCGECEWYEDDYCDMYGKLVYDWYECMGVKPKETVKNLVKLDKSEENTDKCLKKSDF